MLSEKSSLSIRLTEPVVPLRSPSGHASRRRDGEMLPPAIVRGLLTLKLAKSTKVSSIELELQAKATTCYAQSAGATNSRIDVTERYKVHSVSTVVFTAGPAFQERRRATSTRPSVQFLESHPGSGVDSRHWQALPEPVARSASLGPLWVSRHLRSDELEINFSRIPARSQLIIDPAPPYPSSANRHSFLSADLNLTGRSQSVASSSRFSEPPSSPIASPSSLTPDIPYGSPASSVHSIRGITLSRTSSIEEAPEDESEGCDASHSIRPDNVAYYGLSRIATGSLGRSSERDHRGRSHSRFFLGRVVHVLGAVKDRVGSRSPRAGSRAQSNDQEERGRSLTKGKGKANVSNNGISVPPETENSEASVADDTNDQNGDGGIVFSEGTYTYPLFFTIPNDSPPTMKAEHGSLIWKVKAEVKRPGAFKTKMTVEKEVIVVCAPKDDNLEEVEAEAVDLRQQWGEQLEYRVQIARRDVPIGGKIPLHLTITPLTEVRMHSISAYLDERTEYYTRTQSRARSDVIRRATLLDIRHNSSHYRYSAPILPLTSDEPDAFRKSPLYRFLRPGQDESEVASSFMGLGPWTIRHQLSVPDSCSILHPSNQAKRSNVMVRHTLKLILRVEKDEETMTTGKKKLFDIVIHIPVHILSCRCTSEWTSLPCYDEALRSERDSPEEALTCPCRTRSQPKARTRSRVASDTLSPRPERGTSPPALNSNSWTHSLAIRSLAAPICMNG